MIYDVLMTSVATYESPAPFARHVLRVQPTDRPGQRVLSSAMEVSPDPAERREGRDFFGNAVTWLSFERPHQTLKVRSSARVEVSASPWPDPQSTPAWEQIGQQAMCDADLSPESPVHFLFPSRHIDIVESIRFYAVESFAPDRPILAGAIDLMRRIHSDFAYVSGITDVSTPPEEAFRLKTGVCQDFAHVMIAGLRGLNIPARYVSGFLRTEPPPGKPRLEGADATHAWVSVWCGDEAKWVGLDPTNALVTAEDHLVVGIGRDYADVAPLDGVIVTSGSQELDVAVDVTPLAPTRKPARVK